jgi:DNA-binding NarL/FixJ family response regulator
LPAQSASAGADFVWANSFYRFQLLQAQTLVRSGDVEAADAALRIARQYRHPAYVYVESTGLLAEAWVAAARERTSDARQLAWRVAEFTRNHGQLAREVLCLQTAVHAERLAVARGGATSPPRLAVPFTQREREVALLVAQGLTNREIAEAVSLSVRTVEGHIYRASCKAGVAQRAEFATMMRHQSAPKLPA